MTGIVANVQTHFGRKVLSFTSMIRKKGARRRQWWHPKLLRNRMYKGYGSGTMMSLDKDTGKHKLNPDKVREYIMPSNSVLDTDVAGVAGGENANFKPYLAPNTPYITVPPVTEWDYLKRMEETWGPASQAVFESINNSHLFQHGGKKSKFGA